MEETLLIVEDVETLERVSAYLDNEDFRFVAYDTETTGLEKDCELVGFSIAAEESVGIYVILARWEVIRGEKECPKCGPDAPAPKRVAKKPVKCKTCNGTKLVPHIHGKLVRDEKLKEASKPLIRKLLDKDLLMHNAAYDCEVTEREMGIQLLPAVHTDTQELAHVLDENEYCGLKEVGARLFGEDAKKEQREMSASVIANGGIWSNAKGEKGIKEMYKADPYILGKYGAKDTILTFKIFYELIPQLFEEGLDQFFYEDESMPLIKGPTYQLNTGGLKLDVNYLKQLEKELTDECARLKSEVITAITPKVKDRYPGTDKKSTFNIGSSSQMAWLMFIRLGNEFKKLTDGGRDLAKELMGKAPYSSADKRRFISLVNERRDELLSQIKSLQEKKAHLEQLDLTPEGKLTLEGYDKQMKALQKQANKMVPEKYMKCDKDVLESYAKKYDWVTKLLQYSGQGKILKTYVKGIQRRMRYGVIYPGFKQHGTTSGRYSSSNPNFQNLPREDKRIKRSIISRPGKVFVGADYSQLEPRVFASTSQDERLMACFAKGEDFYSVVGIPIFKDFKYSAYKKDENSWAEAFPIRRHLAKAFALATPYGTSAFQQADKLRDEEGNNLTPQQCQEIIDSYFEEYPSVQAMMLDSHEMAKRDGKVYNLFGRPRRIPEAKRIPKIYGNSSHSELPYEARTLLNLAMNHRVQSTAASIVNRAMIAFYKRMNELKLDCRIVLQIHDEIVVECREEDAQIVSYELRNAMENTVTLPGVNLVAEPKIARNLAELK
jgi:DNA polymerase I-like protein with 3'-5' exonuclease and polymerase domains